jgi:hypothetical protein
MQNTLYTINKEMIIHIVTISNPAKNNSGATKTTPSEDINTNNEGKCKIQRVLISTIKLIH